MSAPEHATHVTTDQDWTILVVGDDLAQINELKLETGRAALLSAADQALEAAPHNLLVDMEHCEFFGSSFIEALFQTWKKLDVAGGKFAVCCCNKNIREVFEVTRLDGVWPICDTRAEAVALSNE